MQEESDFAGAEKALNIIPTSTKLIVVGEPTDLELVKGQKGLVYLKIICRGKSAHGSMPEKGINAIEKLMESLQKLKKINFEEDGLLGKNVINIGKISGGDAPNVVPDYAEATVVIRNSINAEKIIEQIKENLKGVEIKIEVNYNPFVNQEIDAITKKLNLKTKIVPYFTEAYFFNKKSKTIIIGAGREEDAHSENEKIKIEDFRKLIDIYFDLIKINQ